MRMMTINKRNASKQGTSYAHHNIPYVVRHNTCYNVLANNCDTSCERTNPEGLSWTNENNEYYWSAINCYCYGCIAFAGEVSDKVFGKNAKVTTHKDFDKIKVGDHIRIGGYHSVIVWKKGKGFRHGCGRKL